MTPVELFKEEKLIQQERERIKAKIMSDDVANKIEWYIDLLKEDENIEYKENLLVSYVTELIIKIVEDNF